MRRKEDRTAPAPGSRYKTLEPRLFVVEDKGIFKVVPLLKDMDEAPNGIRKEKFLSDVPEDVIILLKKLMTCFIKSFLRVYLSIWRWSMK